MKLQNQQIAARPQVFPSCSLVCQETRHTVAAELMECKTQSVNGGSHHAAARSALAREPRIPPFVIVSVSNHAAQASRRSRRNPKRGVELTSKYFFPEAREPLLCTRPEQHRLALQPLLSWGFIATRRHWRRGDMRRMCFLGIRCSVANN